jgi:alkylation response protein AidB-like acyl-CoA dehydrogenase
MPEYRDRLMRLRGEALASKYHGMRLLSDQARDEDPGIRRMIVKLGGTILAYKITSLAIDVLGEAGLPYDPHGEDAEDDPATNWQVDYMYDVGLIIGGGSSNIQRNIIAERGLGLPRELKPPAPDTGG